MHLAGILILQFHCPYCEDCSNNNELWIIRRKRATLYYAFVYCKRDYLNSHRSSGGQTVNVIGKRKKSLPSLSATLPCLTVSFLDFVQLKLYILNTMHHSGVATFKVLFFVQNSATECKIWF